MPDTEDRYEQKKPESTDSQAFWLAIRLTAVVFVLLLSTVSFVFYAKGKFPAFDVSKIDFSIFDDDDDVDFDDVETIRERNRKTRPDYDVYSITASDGKSASVSNRTSSGHQGMNVSSKSNIGFGYDKFKNMLMRHYSDNKESKAGRRSAHP